MFTVPSNVESMPIAPVNHCERGEEEDTLTGEERPAEGRKKEQSPLDRVIDKAQEKRRGTKASDFVDKAIDRAQDSGLTDKLVQKGRDKLSGRRSGTNR